jgi:hypothetical protein
VLRNPCSRVAFNFVIIYPHQSWCIFPLLMNIYFGRIVSDHLSKVGQTQAPHFVNGVAQIPRTRMARGQPRAGESAPKLGHNPQKQLYKFDPTSVIHTPYSHSPKPSSAPRFTMTSPTAAFVGLGLTALTPSRNASRRLQSSPARRRRFAAASPRIATMCEERTAQRSAADRTREALSAEKPLVKFRRSIDADAEQDTSFAYTSGTAGGGVDVWLISGVLLFLVPLVVFGVGVATGYIDVNPR